MSGGMLNVHGDLNLLGAFAPSGGTIVLRGELDRPFTVQAGAQASLHTLEIGSGTGATWVQLTSNLDINGDLTINHGAALQTGAHTITLGGQLANRGGSFDPASNVDFDDPNSAIGEAERGTLLSEDFAAFAPEVDNDLFNFRDLLPDWSTATEGNVQRIWRFQKDPFDNATAAMLESFAFQTETGPIDTWFFLPQLTFVPGVTYQLEFDYAVGTSDDKPTLTASVGAYQLPSGMTTTIVNKPDVSNTTVETARQTFTVTSAGAYTIGFRATAPDGRLVRMWIDNIRVIANPAGDAGASIYLPLLVK